MATMPAEIVAMILQFLHASDDPIYARTFTNSLCVCRDWRDAGLSTLYTDVTLHSVSRLIGFVDAPVPEAQLKRIRTLSISFPEQEPRIQHFTGRLWPEIVEDKTEMVQHGNEATRKILRALQGLSKRLPEMELLHTFSLSVQPPSTVYFVVGFHIRHELLCKIVRALPSSLQNLELDTETIDIFDATTPRSHVCAAIADRCGQLVSLRLRMCCLCDQIFRPSQTLRSLVISTVDQAANTVVKRCPPLTDSAGGETDQLVNSSMNCNELTRSLHGMLEAFPSLEECIMLDIEGGRLSGYLSLEPRRVRGLNARDLLENRTTTYPVFKIGGRDIYVVLRRLTEEESETDIVGFIGQVDQIAEGMPWQTTFAGVRLPHYLKNTNEGLRHQWSNENPYMTLEQYRELTNDGWKERSVDVLPLEWATGRRLVHARVSNGVLDVAPLLREEYPDPSEQDDSDDDPACYDTDYDEEDDDHDDIDYVRPSGFSAPVKA